MSKKFTLSLALGLILTVGATQAVKAQQPSGPSSFCYKYPVIVDGEKGNNNICAYFNNGGFPNCPEGWTPTKDLTAANSCNGGRR